MKRMKGLRLIVAALLLAVSLCVLAWGLWPAARERLTREVQPAEMSIPTPSSFVPGISPGG